MRDFDHISSILVVVDTSESAQDCWDIVTETVRRLLAKLPEDSIEQIGILGSSMVLPRAYFEAAEVPAPPRAPSLLAPVIDQAQRSGFYHQLGLLVGNGEVFDLPDWPHHPATGRWALLQVGADPMAAPGLGLPTFHSNNLDGLYTWLSTIKSYQPNPVVQSSSIWGHAELHWSADQTGYPMLYVEPLHAWMHLFPVLKAQFEVFLASTPGYGDKWYSQLLAANPRLSFRSDNFAAYEQLLLTGVLLPESQAFVHWQGPNYSLPTLEEWRTAYQWMEGYPAPPPLPDFIRNEPVQMVWNGLLNRLNPSNLQKLALMDQGVIEWLANPGTPIGMGRTRPAFHPKLIDPLNDDPVRPIDATNRLKHFGFRLLRRENK